MYHIRRIIWRKQGAKVDQTPIVKTYAFGEDLARFYVDKIVSREWEKGHHRPIIDFIYRDAECARMRETSFCAGTNVDGLL